MAVMAVKGLIKQELLFVYIGMPLFSCNGCGSFTDYLKYLCLLVL